MRFLFNPLNKTIIMDSSIVILTLVFLAMFLVPFVSISVMHKIKDKKKSKQDGRLGK